MRIGLDLRAMGLSGEESYARNLLAQFAETDNFFYLFTNPENAGSFPKSANVEVINVPEQGYTALIGSKFNKLASEYPLDIFHALHISPPPELNCPFVVTIHQIAPILLREALPGRFSRRHFLRLIKNCIGRATRIITVSEAIKSYLLASFDLSSDFISVIYQGVGKQFKSERDEDAIAQVKKRYGLMRKYLLYVGEFSPHKNIARLIQAFGRLPEDLRSEFQLVLTGKQTREVSSLKTLTTTLHLSDHVTFTGFISERDLHALYQGATTFVFPSLHEGFGLPPLEAMASGTPMIVARSSSLPEVVGDAGLFIDPESTEDLTAEIIHVLTDNDLQCDLKARGLARANKFRWEKTSSETLDLYRDVINETVEIRT